MSADFNLLRATRWLLTPEGTDAATASGVRRNVRHPRHSPLLGLGKTLLWIALSVTIGLALGRLH